MKLELNREYAFRHLGVAALAAVLCAWFAYDGFVRYPATPAAALYEEIESAPPPGGDFDLEAFKSQKTKTQRGFAALALLAAAVIGGRLFAASRVDISFDDSSFSIDGEKYSFDDILAVDDSAWGKKGILRIAAGGEGKERAAVLDSWHHKGAKELASKILEAKGRKA